MPKREMEVLTPQMYYVLLVLHQPMHGYEIMNKIEHKVPYILYYQSLKKNVISN